MVVDGRLPSVPEYYAEHINYGVSLVDEPKQCCPFHDEKTPSFSYNKRTGRWSCFGQCHAHGDVVEMHRRWFHFESTEEARHDLYVRYNVPEQTQFRYAMSSQTDYVSEDKVEDEATYARALALANTHERWIELDYAMSKVPYDRAIILELIYKWQDESQAR